MQISRETHASQSTLIPAPRLTLPPSLPPMTVIPAKAGIPPHCAVPQRPHIPLSLQGEDAANAAGEGTADGGATRPVIPA